MINRWLHMRLSSILFFPVLLLFGNAFCCTSFSWFGWGGPIYAMNFDWYPDSEISFSLSHGENGSTVFTMCFTNGDSAPIPTVGMNSYGVFSSMQIVDDPQRVREPEANERMAWEPFYYGLWQATGYSEILQFVKFTPLVQHIDTPLHLHFACTSNAAMIVEVTDRGNTVVDLGENEFMVMTNLSNSSFTSVSPDDVDGCGAGRYRTAHSLLSARSSLDVMTAFSVLEATLGRSASCPTRASMVFDPLEGDVYIALDGEMERIWKVSIQNAVVEGFQGLSGELSIPLPEEGVTGEELLLLSEGS